MKRLLIIILIFAGYFNLKAQDVVLLNYNALERKYDKSLEKTQHEKKGSKGKTWFKHGQLLQDIYKIDLEYIGEGTGITELKLYYKEPVSVQTEQEGPNVIKTLEYPRINYVFVNDALSRWEKTQQIVDEPLDKAYEAYMKALELDEKGKLKDDVKEQLTELKSQYMQSGINAYYNEKPEKALEDFEMVLNINDIDMFEGVVDTIMIQYSGIIAREDGKYKKAAEYYQKLADMNYGGPSVYLNIKNDYLQLGDSAMAISAMEEAFSKYTDTINVVANLIDLYIKTDNIDQGLVKIEEAISNNPQKGELYYWKGRLLLNTEDEDRIDKAIEAYEKAIEMNPSLYYVYYDIGFIYFLQGQDIFSQAGLEQDTKRREEINNIAVEKYEEALPMLQKAYELNDVNMDIKCETLDVLKRIYYKLGMEDDYNRVTAEIN
ncbi:MAG: tetratricopeptide repeat protein, partial [Bacteroidales bacterium]